MKLIIIIMTSFMVQVSAASFAQHLTYSKKNVTLEQIFREIERQTKFKVLYSDQKLDDSKVLDVSFKDVPLEEVMKTVLKNLSVTFEIEQQTIIVKEKENSLIEAVKERVLKTLNSFQGQQDSILFKGKVLDEKGQPLPGATIYLKGGTKGSVSRADGYFERYGTRKGTFIVKYVGYQLREISLAGLEPAQQLVIKMQPGQEQLGQVDIVSTGYQDLPKERATGSFEVITKEMLQHSTDPNLIRRLEGITTSMDFQNQLTPLNSAAYTTKGLAGLTGVYARSPLANLTIRGRNTLEKGSSDPTETGGNSSGQPLVVIDGIASAYSIDQVDPNDVENITILKDAAAASVWGAKAANGVIVVKTKRGTYDKPLNISFNMSLNVTDKINLFYKKYMSTSDYIDAQAFKYNSSTTIYGDPRINVSQQVISPVAEILNEVRLGRLSAADATAQLDALRGNDIRKDFEKYIQRNAINQNYNLSVDGGSKNIAYRLSGSYNNTLNNTIKSGTNRLTFNYNTSIHVLKNLDATVGITYGRQRSNDQQGGAAISSVPGGAFHPYTQLADDNGNPLVIPYTYRPAFIRLLSSTYGSNIQDLTYTPLVDINQGYMKTDAQNVNLNFGLNYRLNEIFSVNAAYNRNIGYNEQNSLIGEHSFFMRELVTRFTSPGTFVHNIPFGGLYRPITKKVNNQTFRGLLSMNKNWDEKHVLSAIAGIDVSQSNSLANSNRYYGYDESNLRSESALDYKTSFTLLFVNGQSGLSKSPIPIRPAATDFSNFRTRTFSTFANAAYTYGNKYTVSASIRKDMSSQFGLGTNKGGTPFYSVGSSWNMVNEDFYHISWLPRLQLRATFGYNGNVNPSISANQNINYSGKDFNTDLYYASTQDAAGPTNIKLRPEKTAMLNFGLDFGLRNNRISGSIEYYDKRTTDLIETGRQDPSTGFSAVPLNTASLHGYGIDLTLNTLNVQSGFFRWNSTFLFSYNRVKVSKLYGTNVNQSNAGSLINPALSSYNEGADLSRLFAYKWAGLDPLTGDPRGYLNGQPVSISTSGAGTAAYYAINDAEGYTLRYFGSIVPVKYGSFRNVFSYGSVSISANILYKLDYYFRRPNSDIVNYYLLDADNILQGIEYQIRWQQPGDELKTNVPSLQKETPSYRDIFYSNSEINVLKADHIRLQEVNISYGFGKKKWFVKNPRIFASVNNLGVLWRANKLGLDPEANDYPNPRSYSLSLSANF